MFSSKSPVFQVGNDADEELTDIKSIDVFTVEIDDISVRNTALSGRGQEPIFRSPAEGFFADQTIIRSIEMPDEKCGEIEWKSS